MTEKNRKNSLSDQNKFALRDWMLQQQTAGGIMKSELTELEIRADQEAEAERIRQLSPEYLAAIERQMGDMHKSITCGEITAEQVALVMLPTVVKMASEIADPSFINTIVEDVEEAFVYADAFIAEMNRRKQKND